MLIPPQELPIPAVGGGAIETLITNLLDENEKHQKVRLIVISTYHSEAAKANYHFSKIYYNNSGIINCSFMNTVRVQYKIRRMLCRIKRKLFKIYDEQFDFFYYQCSKIAKKEGVDIVINEGDWNTQEYKIFYKSVGRNNLYYHLHCEIKEDLAVRECIPNSIAISKYIRGEWAKSPKINGRDIVLYNCIDVSRFSQVTELEKRNESRRTLGFSESDFLVIFCGRLIPEKGIDKLLDAFDILKGSSIRLLVIGSVEFSKGNTTKFSKDVVRRAQEMPSVKYLGYVPNEELSQYYAIADLQVVPSVWQEGAGLVCIEGMASGLPLIVTNSGGMVEYVTDECSVKVPLNEEMAQNIAKEIVRLSQNKPLLSQMGSAGRKRAQQFTKEKYYMNFIESFGVKDW